MKKKKTKKSLKKNLQRENIISLIFATIYILFGATFLLLGVIFMYNDEEMFFITGMLGAIVVCSLNMFFLGCMHIPKIRKDNKNENTDN